jgi:hypothetical protein
MIQALRITISIRYGDRLIPCTQFYLSGYSIDTARAAPVVLNKCAEIQEGNPKGKVEISISSVHETCFIN